MQSTIPYRTLGRTGERVSRSALEAGISDWNRSTSRLVSGSFERRSIGHQLPGQLLDYNDGASETRMGKALRDGYRQKVFLMTKIDGRS